MVKPADEGWSFLVLTSRLGLRRPFVLLAERRLVRGARTCGPPADLVINTPPDGSCDTVVTHVFVGRDVLLSRAADTDDGSHATSRPSLNDGVSESVPTVLHTGPRLHSRKITPPRKTTSQTIDVSISHWGMERGGPRTTLENRSNPPLHRNEEFSFSLFRPPKNCSVVCP